MDRCHHNDTQGDALHAVLCAARYKIHWLLRMIDREGMGMLLCLWLVSGWGACLRNLPKSSTATES
jgi:IS5 family transposase